MHATNGIHAFESRTIPFGQYVQILNSNDDPLDFIERDVVVGSIVKLGGSGRFMGGNSLCLLQRATSV